MLHHFKDGKEAGRIVGFRSEDAFVDELKKAHRDLKKDIRAVYDSNI